MNEPLEITFTLDGTGAVWDVHEPHHLDGLLAYAWRVCAGRPMDCDPAEPPEEAELPLDRRVHAGGEWHWCASVLVPDEIVESVQWARRRLDEERVHLQSAAVVSTVAGLCKTTNRPWPIVLSRHWRAWCVGDRAQVSELLRSIKAIGRERARGRGAVVDVDVRPVDQDSSCERDGLAMRYLPAEQGTRLVRPRPPYWHMHGRTRCLSVGDRV